MQSLECPAFLDVRARPDDVSRSAPLKEEITGRQSAADSQPFFQVTPTRPPFLFRQITRQDQNVWQLSKVRSKLSGKSVVLPASKRTQAPSVVRLSTMQSCATPASFAILQPRGALSGPADARLGSSTCHPPRLKAELVTRCGATGKYLLELSTQIKAAEAGATDDEPEGLSRFCCGVALCPGIAVFPSPSNCPAASSWRRCARLLCTSLTPSLLPNAARRSSSQQQS
jgi:hypothetical protein